MFFILTDEGKAKEFDAFLVDNYNIDSPEHRKIKHQMAPCKLNVTNLKIHRWKLRFPTPKN